MGFEFVPPRITGGVVVADVGGVVLQRADDVPFHDLHVVDIVEEFEAFGADLLAEFHAPSGAIAHVVLVVYL